MALIGLQNLGQQYKGQYVLKNVNLEIDRGDVLAIIGPTGAGKTTLMRLLDLLEPPAAGQIYFDGMAVTRSGSHQLKTRRRMSYVQQKPVVFSMSVYDNIACGLKWRHGKKEVIRQRVEDALELVDLADYRNRDARTLSGGETQRVAIARALVTEPEVLLLDEPTANLDPISVSKIEDILTRIIKEKKTTMVMATHDMSQGQRLASRIGVLINGELLQVGNPNEIFWAPTSKQVAEFVTVENIIAGVISSSRDGVVSIEVSGKIIEGISSFDPGEEVCACIRAEDITLALSKTPSSARNAFLGQITRVVLIGPLARVEVDCGFPLVALVTKRSAEELDLQSGKDIYASFKATGVHIIKSKGD
jgi:tungstate transport system ATP-binding protein